MTPSDRRWVPALGIMLIVLLSVSAPLSISLIYELIEWGAAVALGQGADAFLGTQGDVWDTQSAMGMAALGAVVAIVLFSKLHDRQIANIVQEQAK